MNEEDAHKLTDLLLCAKQVDHDQVKALVAGGGHSGLFTEQGHLYLWGWNNRDQLAKLTFLPYNVLVDKLKYLIFHIDS